MKDNSGNSTWLFGDFRFLFVRHWKKFVVFHAYVNCRFYVKHLTVACSFSLLGNIQPSKTKMSNSVSDKLTLPAWAENEMQKSAHSNCRR